ncbi:MAG: hypothetical protein ABIB71_03770 [Candidatus Woesearchaeota archaeon]
MLTEQKWDIEDSLSDKSITQDIEKLFDKDLEYNLQPNRKFSRFSPMYSFATENLSGYFPVLPMQGKKILTVSGSGDHIINAYMFGATEVDAFDVNILSAFISELKLQALKELSFKEFKGFFLRESPNSSTYNLNALDFEVYKQLKGGLSHFCSLFFDKAYEYFDFDGSRLRESYLFNNKYDLNQKKIQNNPYLQSKHNFEEVKRLSRKNHNRQIISEVQNLGELLGKKQSFDVILLSNIVDYAKIMFPESKEYLGAFCDSVIEPLKMHLTEEGIICAAYIYVDDNNPYSKYRTEVHNPLSKYRSAIDDPEKRRLVFQGSGMKYYEITFESVIPEEKDAVVLLQK